MTTRSWVGLGAAAGLVVGMAWARRTAATCDEKRMPLPGDELVPEPMWQATRATTIDAPPEDVWPWLAQMGFPTHRAGWYTPYWLDRILFDIHAHSADRIIPELQRLAVGDRVLDSDSGVSYFTAAVVDRPRALVLHSHTHPLPMYRDVHFAWAFVLRRDGSRTRLMMRARITYAPVWPAAFVRTIMLVGFGIGDVIQAGAMLNGIRSRAERRGRAPSSGGEIVIRRPVEEVFDFVADERNVYDPTIVHVEKLTAGPVGPGTRFRSESRGMGGTVPMTVEVTAHERPRRLVSRTHSPVVDIDSTLGFEPFDGGTRLRWESELRPRGMLRMLARVMPSLAERRQAEIFGRLKLRLEGPDEPD